MPKRHHSQNIDILHQLLEESFQKKSWHGPNLHGAIRGISPEQAAWRPASNRHNIWEIVVHCAYWKYTVRRRLTGEKRGSFPYKGSNWFKRPQELTKSAWDHDVQLLISMHASMMNTIAALSDSDLNRIAKGSRYANRFVITGIASHDVYHAGQIQLLKRLIH